MYTRVSVRGKSFPTPGQTNRWDTNLTVALALGWLGTFRGSTSKVGTGVDAEIDAGVDQDVYPYLLIRHIEAAVLIGLWM